MGLSQTIYSHLPLWAQHTAVSAYGAYWYWMRFGFGHEVAVKAYAEREKFTGPEWRQWQQLRLQETLKNAATKVPFYMQSWSKVEKAAALAGRLHKLPLLEKEPIRQDPESFIRADLRARPELVFHTSGSTGTPIASFWKIAELRESMALREARSARWAGVSFRRPRATFSGRLAEPDPQSSGPFYRFNIVERQAYLSPFHLRPDTAKAYVDAFRRHRIEWLTGYAVSYYLLAEMMLEQRLSIPSLKAVITTSEKVTTEMRGVMESAFGCKVYEEYSTVENTLFASECEEGQLHISPEAGVVEILRPDGSPCDPGEVGEVVATSLMRFYQPFIRYRLGDLAMWSDETCGCGRAMPVIKEVVGRLEDVVIGVDGRRLVRFHGIFVDQPNVREGQIIQEKPDLIRVRVVPTPRFQEADVVDIVGRVQQRMGPTTTVVVEQVEQIPRTAQGKFQAVISLMANGRSLETQGESHLEANSN